MLAVISFAILVLFLIVLFLGGIILIKKLKKSEKVEDLTKDLFGDDSTETVINNIELAKQVGKNRVIRTEEEIRRMNNERDKLTDVLDRQIEEVLEQDQPGGNNGK